MIKNIDDSSITLRGIYKFGPIKFSQKSEQPPTSNSQCLMTKPLVVAKLNLRLLAISIKGRSFPIYTTTIFCFNKKYMNTKANCTRQAISLDI